MNETTISVIIPAFNEEKYIKRTILAILSWSINSQIIVVDDGSTDRTLQIANNLMEGNENINVISLEKNGGKGNALNKGLQYTKGNIVMFLDADLGDSAKEAIKLIYPILNDNIDMTVAIIPSTNTKAGFGLAKNLAKKGIYYLTGFHSKAPLSGQRAVKKKLLEQIANFADGFGIEVGLTIDGLHKGWLIKEIEVSLRHRESKRDLIGFMHRGKEFADITKALYIRRRWVRL
ncbi:MAG: glycosyltransferase family 2 protein [Vulcanibacillus sp.]